MSLSTNACHPMARQTAMTQRTPPVRAPDSARRSITRLVTVGWGFERELELRDHAQVAATATDRPEQIRMLGLRHLEYPPDGSDDAGADEVVARQLGRTHQPTDATTQGQAGDTRPTDETAGHRQAVRLRRGVKLSPGRPATAPGMPGRGVDRHRLHRRQDNHQPTLGERGPRNE